MEKCAKCGKNPHDRFLNCPKCNPNNSLIACKCQGCQCEGSFAPDGDFMPKGYGYNFDGDIVRLKESL